MNELNNNTNNENILKNNHLTQSLQENPNQKLNLNLPDIKLNNIKNDFVLNNSKLPPIKSNYIRKTSTSVNSTRDNKLNSSSNYSSLKNNNNYIQTYSSKDNLVNRYSNNMNKQLDIIKDENGKNGYNIHYRNLELIKRLVEKRKKLIEEKVELSNKHEKNPIERLNLFKKSLVNNGISLIQYKKLEPLNLYSNLNEVKKIDDDTIYYYQINHEGNSSEVIEQCLKRRGHWKLFNNEEMHNNNNSSSNIEKNSESKENNSKENNNNVINFMWSHCSSKINFDYFIRDKPGSPKKMTNHFEFHTEISNKLNLFINMMIFCEKFNHDLFSMLPMTFPIKYESKFYLRKMNSFMNIFNNIEKYISDKHIELKYRNLFELEINGRIGSRTPFFIPKNHFCGRNLWLVKAIDLNRGRCIKISDNLKEIENIIKNFYRGVKKDFYKDEKSPEKLELPKLNININSNTKEINTMANITKVNSANDLYNKEELMLKRLNGKQKKKLNLRIKLNNSNINNNSPSPKKTRENILNTYKQYKLYQNDPNTYQNSSVIIQKYIEKPLCYKGRKCDMRLWILLTWDFNVYLFKEGHFKASSVPYDVNSINAYVHLTNYSVQKYNQDFAKFEMGNEISFKDFEISVNNEINVKKDLIPKLKEIIIYTMKCAKNKINKRDRRLCFEIFGYDFMFDIEYKPYLLEINTNPGLEISSPLIEMLIPRLIDDAFKLTIDKVFSISQKNLEKMKKKPFKVGGYDDEENMWELLGNVMN